MPSSEPSVPHGPVIGRRAFLAGLVASAVAAGCSGGDDEAGLDSAGGPEGVPPETGADLPPVPSTLPAEVFTLGVASGDPLPDAVILWTRLVSDPLVDGGGLPDQPLPVRWEVATTDAFDERTKLCFEVGIAHGAFKRAERVLDEALASCPVLQRDRDT